MEGSTYTNIFETKGIEYLIIILFFAVLIPFWIILNKKTNMAKYIRNTVGVLTANALKIPQGLFYNKNHTWVYMEKSGDVKIGLDDFLIKIVGDVHVRHIKLPGKIIKKGDLIAEIGQDGKRLKVKSPISGEIIQNNNLIFEIPETIINDPYGKGWIYAIKPFDWKNETATCFMAGEATNWLKNELQRFKDFLNISLGKYSNEPSMIVFQEGGELKINVLAELQPEIWDDFQEEFLD